MRVLFTTTPFTGCFHPLVPLARALQGAGHEVAFAAPGSLAPLVRASGFDCLPAGMDNDEVRRILMLHYPEWQTRPEHERSAFAWRRSFAGLRAELMAQDVVDVASRWRPDVLVREEAELGGCIAAEHLGLPHAAVQVVAYSALLPAMVAEPLGRLRHQFGLPPDPNAEMLYRYLLLAPRPPSYQNLAFPLPQTAHAVRPFVFDQSGDEVLPAWIATLPSWPLVYLTFGTVVFGHGRAAFGAALEGLRSAALAVIATVGRDQDAEQFGPQSEHVHVERYVPQSLVFPRCQLVVCHGGSGTVMGALSQGLPMVIIPWGADQPQNAARCAALGVAKVLDPAVVTPETVRAAALEVLQEPSYRQNAERLRDEIDTLPGHDHAAALVERLARERRPLLATAPEQPAVTAAGRV